MLTELIVRCLDRLPCGRCGAPGPHEHFQWELRGTTATCETCRAVERMEEEAARCRT